MTTPYVYRFLNPPSNVIAGIEWNAGDDDGDDDDADAHLGVIVRGPLPVTPQNRGTPH